MAGNVWEWNHDDDKQWGKVLCGGAYWNDANRVGAAARDRADPWSGDIDFGLRVVAVPISRSGKVLVSGF